MMQEGRIGYIQIAPLLPVGSVVLSDALEYRSRSSSMRREALHRKIWTEVS